MIDQGFGLSQDRSEADGIKMFWGEKQDDR